MKTNNWDDIRYFLALVEAGSLSATARLLSVEHSTVSRRIDLLEQQLGIRLFDRMPRGWLLTEEGKSLIAPAQQMLEGAQRIKRIVSASTSLAGTVRVSVPPLLGKYLLAPHLPRLRESLPEIALELVSELQDVDLHRREADIALRMRRPEQPDLAARLLTQIPYGLYASSDYLEKHSPKQWQFVGYEKSMHTAPQQQWLDSQLDNRPIIFRSNDLHVLATAVMQGVGIGILPLFLQTLYPNLTMPSHPICPIKRDLWLVIHPDLRRSPRVRAVADEIIRWFELS